MDPTKPAIRPPSNKGTWLVLGVLGLAIGLLGLRFGLQAYCCHVVDRAAQKNGGGLFFIDAVGPDWLDAALNDRLQFLLGDPDSVSLSFAATTPRHEISHVLWCLSELQSIEFVLLEGNGILDEDLEKLRVLSKLTDVSLVNTRVTARGLAALASLPRIERLPIIDSPSVDNAALVPISQMYGLTLLRLDGTSITDAGLKQLTSLTQLDFLSLEDTSISDAGLLELRHLKKLQHLETGRTQVTDAGIEALREAIPGLEVLDD